MKKFLKIAAVVIAVAVLIASGVVAYLYRAASSIPDFYTTEKLAGDDRLRAIESVERKLGNMQGAFDEAVAVTRMPSVAPDAGPDDMKLEPINVSFTASELDTYLSIWLRQTGFGPRMSKYMAEPRIAFVDGRLVLAGTMPDFGDRVVSLHLLPEISDEQGTTLM
ncbi:MAG: hypothetical protein AAGK78_08805, partial [Planctomycetota bacterium]